MKQRFIALTDIYREPDDKQFEIDDVESLCRLLLYTNEIDLEGIIATTSFCLTNGAKESNRRAALDIIDAYEQVKPNLDVHAPGYPEADILRNITKCGIPEFGEALGRGFGHERYNDNEGVDHIIQVVDRDDPRPVWIGLWGGCNTLAQAVWKVWTTRSEDAFNQFLSKLRIYAISDQDRGGIWLRQNFGDRLFYIVSPSAGDGPGAAAFANAAWQGMSFDHFQGQTDREGFRGADDQLVSNEWIRDNICGDTPYRRLYPVPTLCMEGDTPTYLGLIPNGLNDMEHPDWGSWGGRYERYLPTEPPVFCEKERFPIWTDAADTVALPSGETETSNFATIWRWREAVQNDFLMRLRWTETPDYADAPHAPELELCSPVEQTVERKAAVTLSASVSNPNQGSMSCRWFHYPEAGGYGTPIPVEQKGNTTACFQAPDEPCTLHFIFEAVCHTQPSVTRYVRAIVHVKP